MDSENTFSGMIIILKKRMSNVVEDDTKQCKFMTLGHYDGMDLLSISEWYKLLPKEVDVISGHVDLKDQFLDKYILRALSPEPGIRKELEEKGFSYALWEEMGKSEKTKHKDKEVLTQYPFVCLSVINLTKEYLWQHNNIVSDLGTRIKNLAISNGIKDLKEIHCAILPSLGYSDYILLFLSERPDSVMKILDELRTEQEKKMPILSNCYTLIGFANEGRLKSQHEFGANTKLSIRVNLRPGISAKMFKKYFDEKICEAMDGIREWKGKSISDLYQMFGNSDCLILSEMPFEFFIPLYYDSNLLNPSHELFRTYICGIRSSVRVGINDTDTRTDICRKKRDIESYKADLDKLVEVMEEAAEKYNHQRRIVNGLKIVIKNFTNLIQASHCFEIKCIIGDAFKALKKNIDKNLEMIGKNSADTQLFYVEGMFEAVNLFRKKIGDYLGDLQRSERSFIEGQPLSHASIGSATKLLFFYNSYINEVSKKLKTQAEYNYTFVVTSGGCDVTKAYDLFAHLEPVDDYDDSIIILSIPEISLYDVKGTLFRLLHECMHFCGERFRKKRYWYLIESFAEYSAWRITDFLRADMKDFSDKVVKPYKCRMDEESYEKLREEIEKILDEEKGIVRRKVSHKIKEDFKKYDQIRRDADDLGLYCRYLYGKISEIAEKNIFGSRISEKDNKEKNFAQVLYEEKMSYKKRALIQLKEKLKENTINFSNANILLRRSEWMAEEYNKGNLIPEEEIFISDILGSYLGNYINRPDFSIAEEEETYYGDILEILIGVVSECFADCMAAKILNLSMEQFLLCFVYETWNPDLAFPNNSLNILRVAVELEVLFSVNGILDEKIFEKLEAKMEYWRERGFQYKIGAVQLWEKINGLLHFYYESEIFRDVMEPIKKYLTECLESIVLEKFCDIRNLSKMADMESVDDIYNLYTCFGVYLKKLRGK